MDLKTLEIEHRILKEDTRMCCTIATNAVAELDTLKLLEKVKEIKVEVKNISREEDSEDDRTVTVSIKL